MLDLEKLVADTLPLLRKAESDLASVEVKCSTDFPKSALNSISAFANTKGGLLLLGLDEDDDFTPITFDAAKVASDLASACDSQLEPTIRADIEIVEIEGKQIVAAYIPELPKSHKPCFVTSRGIENGSFIRVFDGDRRLSTYEVHVLRSERAQPTIDSDLVPGATIADLDATGVGRLLERLRTLRGPAFSDSSDVRALQLAGVLRASDAPQITLAGILALGPYPQQYFPQLNVTLVAYATIDGKPLPDGTRFLDNRSIDGPIPYIISETIAAVQRNMSRSAVINGATRRDLWQYPTSVVRELVANALMHRDYHPMARGSQTRVEIFPDRLVVTSPGGAWGPINRAKLSTSVMTSSRNARLAKLLEDVPVPNSVGMVCENRGSGLIAASEELRQHHMQPLFIRSSPLEFRVTVFAQPLNDTDAETFIASLGSSPHSEGMKQLLVYLKRNRKISLQTTQAPLGESRQSTLSDLAELVSRGFIESHTGIDGTCWTLSETAFDRSKQPEKATTLTPARLGADPRDFPERFFEILEILDAGPMSRSEIAEALSLGEESTRRWLVRMEKKNLVSLTHHERRHPENKWRLTNRQKSL